MDQIRVNRKAAERVASGHPWIFSSDVSDALAAIKDHVESLPDDGEKITVTPEVGTELFRLGRLTEKVGQFRLLAEGNPRPETTAVSPLYQITVGAGV